MATTLYPTASLRADIERVAASDLPAPRRVSELRAVRDELEGLLALTERYLSEASRQRDDVPQETTPASR